MAASSLHATNGKLNGSMIFAFREKCQLPELPHRKTTKTTRSTCTSTGGFHDLNSTPTISIVHGESILFASAARQAETEKKIALASSSLLEYEFAGRGAPSANGTVVRKALAG